jgi:hypothetical protein
MFEEMMMQRKNIVLLSVLAGVLMFSSSFANDTQKKCDNCAAPFFIIPFLNVFNPGPTFAEPF